ncbi:MAG: ATP-binding protein [Pseudomonadota bacterium]|nr:ATP-binding protein [Pseudomonadota bacterium]
MFILLGGYRGFVHEHGFHHELLAQQLGFSADWINQDYQAADAVSRLRQLYQETEQAQAQASETIPAELAHNIAQLSELVGLSPLEGALLAFAALIHTERSLDDASDYLGLLTSAKTAQVLSVILNVPHAEVRAALDPQSRLVRSGLLMVDRQGSYSLRNKLELLSGHFADHLLSNNDDPIHLLRDTILPTSPPNLGLVDYPHIQPSLDLLLPYLRQVLQQHQVGVNIFIHGAAGTGKSQLVRVLAAALATPLFEIASEDEDGDPVDAMQRLRAYRAAQSVFAQKQALLIFDEIEDVFNDTAMSSGLQSTAQSRKAWINRMLETNPVPAFWVSNADELDPAFVRRFDLVIEMPIPPKKQRLHMIEQLCGEQLSRDSQNRLASAEALSPAVLARAHQVAQVIHQQDASIVMEYAIEHLVSSTLKAQGHRPLVKQDPNQLPEYYDPALLKTDVSVEQIASGLAKHASGRLCLYGAAGTGKTAFARWLAERLDKPLLVKRGSDLLSRWLGGTEQNLAQAFADAEQQSAILLIDEVDGFLKDRNQAQQSWEVSTVNELLVQMESFAGILIASTNRLHDLDQAALRRFDFKIEFQYLGLPQRLQLLQRVCAQLDLLVDPTAVQQRLASLNRLTVGDFAVIVRQSRFHPFVDVNAVLDHLEQEVKLKGDGARGMGFVR